MPTLTPNLIENAQAADFLLLPESNAELEASAAALADAVRSWRIGYVVVWPQLLDQDELERIEEMLDTSAVLCPAAEQDNVLLYRARWHPDGCDDDR